MIIDGHNRYEICTRNNIHFETKQLELSTREEAINWIIDHQLGRRNLAPWQMSILRGKRYNIQKKQGVRTDLTSDQIDHKLTSEKLADQFGVSAPTIRRDGNFATAAEKTSETEEIPVMELTKKQIRKCQKDCVNGKIH